MISEIESGSTASFTPETAFEVRFPVEQQVPVVFASPHSGRRYPASLLNMTQLDPQTLRRSEDAFVDDLFADVVDLGAPMIVAHFPRVYLDANREAMELDPDMYSDPLPDHAITRSPRVAAGIGTIAKVVSSGQDIYDRLLPYAEAKQRIETCYLPYHAALKDLIDNTVQVFGTCLMVDCHSMPSRTGDRANGLAAHRADVVLGDRWGSTCDQSIVKAAERAVLSVGYSVRRNTPYAGGYTTQQYGQPGAGIHTLQVEIDRSLYMDERSITRLPVFDEVRARVATFAASITQFGSERLAAE